LIAGFSQAQESTFNTVPASSKLTYHEPTPQSMQVSKEKMNSLHEAGMKRFNNHALAAKTTGTPESQWYELWNQNYNNPDSPSYHVPNISVLYYWPTFPDSNLYDAPTGGTPFYVFTHGMGQSFDPTDSAYFSPTFNNGCLTSSIVQPMAPTGQSYTIDSFYAPIQYVRHDNTSNDSLIIELIVAISPSSASVDTGVYNLHFSASSDGCDNASDCAPRFATVHYNPGDSSRPAETAPYNTAAYSNDCYYDSVFVAAPYKQRWALKLTSATVGDTDANGYLNLGLLAGVTPTADSVSALPLYNFGTGTATPVTLNSNEHMVAFVTFKSGHASGTYPFGTNVTAANYIGLLAGSSHSSGGLTPVTSSFLQGSANTSIGYPGSYSNALVLQNQSRFSDTMFTPPTPLPTHDLLIPDCAYNGYYDMVETTFEFHVTWTATPSLGVNNVKNIVNDIKAYPNPATNTLNITYTLTGNAPVSVTLMNMVGQTVATQAGLNGQAVFNVTDLPAGVYMFSLVANGERTTERVVIAH